MPLTSLEVRLSRSEALYAAGEELGGIVRADASGGPVSFTDFSLAVQGSVHLHWTEGSCLNRVRGDEIVLDVVVPIARAFNLSMLPIGRSEIPFRVRLPSDLPYSYSDSVASVRYVVVASIKISALFTLQRKATIDFKIAATLDPHSAGGGLPLEIRETPLVYAPALCVAIPKGLFDVVFRLPKRGFVPGETAAATGLLRNASKVELRELSVDLVEVRRYTAATSDGDARTKERETAYPLVQLALSLAPGFSVVFDSRRPLQLRIPSDVCVSLLGCGSLSLSYFLHLRLDHVFSKHFPIVIGSKRI